MLFYSENEQLINCSGELHYFDGNEVQTSQWNYPSHQLRPPHTCDGKIIPINHPSSPSKQQHIHTHKAKNINKPNNYPPRIAVRLSPWWLAPRRIPRGPSPSVRRWPSQSPSSPPWWCSRPRWCRTARTSTGASRQRCPAAESISWPQIPMQGRWKKKKYGLDQNKLTARLGGNGRSDLVWWG